MDKINSQIAILFIEYINTFQYNLDLLYFNLLSKILTTIFAPEKAKYSR